MRTQQPLGKRLLAGLLTLCIVCGMLPFSLLTASALQVDAGTGTKQNPIPIRTAQELADMAGMINSGAQYSVLDIPAGDTVYYRLEADISLGDYTGGAGWTPIGTEDNPFTGHFDGNGHTISGMQITDQSITRRYVGLFGVIGKQGSVSSLRIADSRVDCGRIGGTTAGLLAGKSAGTMENCEIGGTVNAQYAGGVVGELKDGTVKTCLVTARISGNSAGGGIYANGTPGELTACAALSPEVSGKAAYALGPDAVKAETCIAWDTMSSKNGSKPDFTGAQAKSIADFQNMQTWADVGNLAFMKYPWTYERELLPSLSGKGQPLPGYMVGGLAGAGTAWDPYTITSLDDLRTFAEMLQGDTRWGVHFKLTTDLDMSAYAYDDPDKGWQPLPKFQGIFDGGGHAIKNLTINRPDENNVGFFGEILGGVSYGADFTNIDYNGPLEATYGIVKNLGIVDSHITGNAYTGGLVGKMTYGHVEGCYNAHTGGTRGTVTGGLESPNKNNPDAAPEGVGGLVGVGLASVMRRCYSTANVNGVWAVGGVTGFFWGNLEDCYTTGDVTGLYGNGVGGVFGMDHGLGSVFRRCYATGNVTVKSPTLLRDFFGSWRGVGGVGGYSVGVCSDFYAINQSVTSGTDNPSVTGNAARVTKKCVGEQLNSSLNERIGGWIETKVNGEISIASGDNFADGFTTPGTWKEFDPNKWVLEDGKLPVLKDVGDAYQDGTKPVWLVDDYGDLYVAPKTDQLNTIYYIETAANLAWCSLNADKLSGKTLRFPKNGELDLSAYQFGGGWVPIGELYTGKDLENLYVVGNGCTITGMTIRRSYNKEVQFGLFGHLVNSTINDLHLRNAVIDTVGGSGGLLVGFARATEGRMSVTNCSAEGSITHDNKGSPYGQIGGLIGMVSTMKSTKGGVVVLENLSASTKLHMKNLTGSYNTGAGSVGGIVGDLDMRHYPQAGSSIKNLYANVEIEGRINNAGGLFGEVSLAQMAKQQNDDRQLTFLSDSYARASISTDGDGSGGGLIGTLDVEIVYEQNENPAMYLNNCYAAGSISASRSGGLIGAIKADAESNRRGRKLPFTIRNSTSLMESVTGKESIGELVGFYHGNSIDNLQISCPATHRWADTTYKKGSYTSNNPTGDNNADSGRMKAELLTTEDVVGRWNGSPASYQGRLFSDLHWKTDEGWSSYSFKDTIDNRKAVGRLPTLTMGGNADKHIYQVGDVPLYISMKHPEYITEFGSDNRYPARVGVYSRADLDYLRTFFEQHRSSLNVHLTRDIQMKEGEDFTPIGHADGNPFNGRFDGHGHVIKNLWVRSLNPDYPVGLIGRARSVDIRNLGLVDPNISGTSYAGGLVGEIIDGGGGIQNCFVSTASLQPGGWGLGSVQGSLAAGGLVGKINNTSSMTISHCYTAINVQGGSAGGLVGMVSDSTGGNQAEVRISDVFAAGQVLGTRNGAGGLIGSLTAGKVDISRAVILSPSIESPNDPEKAWYVVGENVTSTPVLSQVQVLAQTRSRGVTRADLTPEQFGKPYTGAAATLEQLHTTNNWIFDSRYWTREAGKSPVLKSFYSYRQGNYLAELPVSEDKLEPNAEGWYEIHNAQDWLTMCNMVNNLIVPYSTGKYKLMADIDLGREAQIFVQYQPAGQGSPFYGEFDGNGKTVRFGQQFSGEGGLFGRLGSGGSIHDLTVESEIQASGAEALGGVVALAEADSTLENITVTGSIRAASMYRVGGIVGDSSGTVKNCVNLASLSLTVGNVNYLQAGGIAGRQRGGVITGCRNEGRVDAGQSSNAAGGLVGNATMPQTLDGPSLQNSLNTGSVSGNSAGGLIGEMTGGLVSGCASTGGVNGTNSAGGLVGRLICPAGYTSGVTDCYATGAVGEANFAGGLIGYLEANNATKQNTVARCYTTSRVTTRQGWGGGVVGFIYIPANPANLVLSDLAALNPGISATNTTAVKIGKFFGASSRNSTAANSFAFDKMDLQGGVTTTKTDGVTDISKETFATISANAAFWNDQMDFGGESSLWNSSGGEGAEVKLPTLLHLNGAQNGELPYHLRTFARPQNTAIEVTADKAELLSPKGQAETVVFTAAITGTTQTAVEWSCSDTNLTATGGTDENGNPICTLTIPAEYKDTYSGGEITVTATLQNNNAITDTTTITVKARTNAKSPEITAHPKDTPTVVGKPAALNVTAQSQDNGALSYQWYETDLPDKDGTIITGATGASYNAPAEQTGIAYYYCVVTNTIPDGEGIGNLTAAQKSAVVQVAVTKDAQPALTIVGGNQVKTYGDADFTLQTSGGSGTGTVTWNSDSPDVVSVDAATGKVTIRKTGEAIITAAKAGDNQFDSSSAQITITVNKAVLTVTAQDKTREYGQANPPLTLTYSGFVKGEDQTALSKEPVASCTAGIDAAVGTHPVTVSGGEAKNYEFVYVAGALTVTKTNQTPISILQGVQINKTYGDGAFTLSVTNGNGNGAVSWKSSDEEVVSVDQTGKVTIRKAGSATITAMKEADGRFVKAQASATVTVKKAVLTVTASNAEKHFGEENPAPEHTITGFVNGENKDALRKQPTVFVDTTLSETELPVGSYVIKVSGGEADNYTFVYQNATLIVNKADQSTFQIEGGNPTKTYGDTPFALTTKNGAGGAVTWRSGDERVAKADEATGEITIIGAGRVLITAVSAETSDYAESIAAVTLTVEKAKLQISADPQTRVYGDENPDFTYSIEGFVNGDEKTNLDTLPNLTADADKKTGVGNYAIRLTGGADDNYEYVLNNAELTITPRPVTIKADDKKMTEGGEVPALTWTVTEGNLLDGDTLEGSLKTDGTGVGTHSITQDTPLVNPNYAVTFLPGTLIVADKPKEPVIPQPDPANPSTGDSAPVWALWAALLAYGGMGWLLRKSRKQKKES